MTHTRGKTTAKGLSESPCSRLWLGTDALPGFIYSEIVYIHVDVFSGQNAFSRFIGFSLHFKLDVCYGRIYVFVDVRVVRLPCTLEKKRGLSSHLFSFSFFF